MLYTLLRMNIVQYQGATLREHFCTQRIPPCALVILCAHLWFCARGWIPMRFLRAILTSQHSFSGVLQIIIDLLRIPTFRFSLSRFALKMHNSWMFSLSAWLVDVCIGSLFDVLSTHIRITPLLIPRCVLYNGTGVGRTASRLLWI